MKNRLIYILGYLLISSIASTTYAQNNVSKTMKKLEFREKPDYYIQNLTSTRYNCHDTTHIAYLVVPKESIPEADFEDQDAVIACLNSDEFKWQIALKRSVKFTGSIKSIYQIKGKKLQNIDHEDLLKGCVTKGGEITQSTQIEFILGEALDKWAAILDIE